MRLVAGQLRAAAGGARSARFDPPAQDAHPRAGPSRQPDREDAGTGQYQGRQCDHRPHGQNGASDCHGSQSGTRRSRATRRLCSRPAPEEAGRAPASARRPAHAALRFPAPAAPVPDRDARRPHRHARGPDPRGHGPVRRGGGAAADDARGGHPRRQAILAETGADMGAFPTAAHFASWARLCPGNHESAGKRQPTTTGKGATWLRATLQEVAWAAVRTKKSYYRALYHRLKGRGGPKKAIVAVQHAMLVALWHMLKHRVPHHDLGADYFDRRNTTHIRRHHVRRLEQLGYDVVLVEKAA